MDACDFCGKIMPEEDKKEDFGGIGACLDCLSEWGKESVMGLNIEVDGVVVEKGSGDNR